MFDNHTFLPRRPNHLIRRICLALATFLAMPVWAATPPIATTLPQVNVGTLIADDTTPYTVNTVVTDADGYNDLRTVRVLFNYTQANGDTNAGRGYVTWGKTDADVTQYGGTWVLADATGGGRWGYRTDAWGGTTYITPLSCQMTPAGKASGGSGTRTVTFSFTVKSAWAYSPVMNSADVWMADGTYIIGWVNGGSTFDVVAAPCSTTVATPHSPLLSNATATTINVQLDPSDSSSNLYAISISPSLGGRNYVQSDGSLGVTPRWASRTTWGTKTVGGLSWNTGYSFSVRGSRSLSGYCPSVWGPAAALSTLDPVPVIDPNQGSAFSTFVRGQCPYRSVPSSGWAPLWDLTSGSLARGLAGGLDADCYDWRDINSGANWGLVGGHYTTLEFLQAARDHNATPLLTANVFGGGYRDTATDGTFICQTVNPAGLAADWVRYTNFILPNFRQGQEAQLGGENQRVYNSIVDWGNRAQLLSPMEAVAPPVLYWEIGNEPELGGIGGFLSNHYLGPTDYRDQYKVIAQAMLAVDPNLKIGPCLIEPSSPTGSGQWLSALAADPTIPVDFIGYHPYYGAIKANWGYLEGMSSALRDYKAYLAGKSAGIRSAMSAAGRSNYGLVASEWNPVNWDAPGYMQSSTANALGTVETCFSFAEDGVLGGTFWEQPQGKTGVSGAYTGLASDMGNKLIASSTSLGLNAASCNFRFYVTTYLADPSKIMIWGINFSDDTPASVHLSLAPAKILSATLKHYGKPGADNQGGDTSLVTSSGMAWDQQDVTAGFDTRYFPFTMEDAEITVLVLNTSRTVVADFERDGDVDLDDFAHLQRCLTGQTIPPTDPGCLDARLDTDGDIDQDDMAKFIRCLSGTDIPVDPNCGN